jgi:FMN reductase (NADPH)/FMN reductase [NAD(P)H]
MDTMIAAHTAVIAAEALGIGSCYIGDIIEHWEEHQKIFNLPRYTFPAALVCFGRPEQPQSARRTARFERRFIVHQDAYRCFSPAELNEVHLPHGLHSFEPREYSNGARNIVQFNYTRKFTAPFSLEMGRSVRAILKNWEDE